MATSLPQKHRSLTEPLADIPALLETSRLVLRQFHERDWDDLHRMFEDEECVRYMIKTPHTHWQTWRMLAGYVGHWTMRGYGPYATVEKSSGKMMGQLDSGIRAIGQSRR